jgi:hypothetical protein
MSAAQHSPSRSPSTVRLSSPIRRILLHSISTESSLLVSARMHTRAASRATGMAGSTGVGTSLRVCELRRGWRAESSHRSHGQLHPGNVSRQLHRRHRRDPASRCEGSSARSGGATRGPCRVRRTSVAARRQWRTAGPMPGGRDSASPYIEQAIRTGNVGTCKAGCAASC